MLLFLIFKFCKEIHFYAFVESIKNQIQIIKINDISLDSVLFTHHLNNLFLFLGRFIIIIIKLKRHNSFKKINKINMKNNFKRII